jgi:tetratricopeptide (TPR) repeat protein
MLSAEVADIYAAMGRELIDAKDYQGAADALHRALILNARQDEALFQMERLRQKLEDLSRG